MLQELDELTNWFKTNVLDFGSAGDGDDIKFQDKKTSSSKGHYGRGRAAGTLATEYEYPHGLLEHIIGVDR